MKALITIVGVAICGQFISDEDKPKSLLNVVYTDEKQLIAKLINLQSGYSLDGRDRPKIQKHSIPSKKYPGTTRKIIDCSTEADWHHVAHIGVSSPSVPTQDLSKILN